MNRYDFLYLFDVKDANPNGDPDAGNLPRMDPETGEGLITDVCIKRKVRNFVATSNPPAPESKNNRIYFTEAAVLNRLHGEAWDNDPELQGAKDRSKLPKDIQKAKDLTAFMCRNFFDIRTFGAVMSTEVNCGQVRGPVQLSFGRSIDPIVSSEHAITRSSVTNERDLEKERTMGRKFTVPYGLYRSYGFVNPFLAVQTGFGDEDLQLIWQALLNAFQFDQSAARPANSMNVCKLIVFKHDKPLGNAPSHKLFDRVTIKRKDAFKPPRDFSDYEVKVDWANPPSGVELIEMI